MKYFVVFILMMFSRGNLIAQNDFNWETSFEKSGFISTSDYERTMAYFQRLADSSEFADLFSFGISPQNRELKCLLVTKENTKGSQTEMNVRKLSGPVVLIINGIHSGEIEGKDASMLLLRELLVTKEKEYLLEGINMIVVPIFNVDGHERKSKYNRINQNGPEEMGWRTTAQNLNLNRDWMKADAPEMQSMLKLVNEWNPDFIIDTHTTDGADYQYTVTYSLEWSKNIYHQTGQWLKENFVPYLENGVEDKGYLIAPYIYLKKWNKGLDGGLVYWPATPRFSTGYFALQNRPSLLIETHMIKPYKERVFATKAMIETTLDYIYENATNLIRLNNEADENAIVLYSKEGSYLPLSFNRSDQYELINFKGYEYYWEQFSISGNEKLVYTNKKEDFSVKYFNDIVVTDSVKIPKGYLIPPEWNELLFNMITFHGIESEPKAAGEKLNVERYHFINIKFDGIPYEGRQPVDLDYEIMKDNLTLDRDMFYIPTNQKAVRVLVNLIEPQSADSYVRWGFMNQIFEQKEYYEDYVMEKLAAEMLANDPDLKREFERKLANDEEFKNNPGARLDFFYERSPYFDQQKNVYPILRVVE
jgi:hypothetical protein